MTYHQRRFFSPEWDWLDQIQVGDILSTPSGDQRLVRHLSRKKNGRLAFIDLAIRNCSWTGRGITTLNRTSVAQRGFKPTGKKADVYVDVSKITCCEAKLLL